MTHTSAVEEILTCAVEYILTGTGAVVEIILARTGAIEYILTATGAV